MPARTFLFLLTLPDTAIDRIAEHRGNRAHQVELARRILNANAAGVLTTLAETVVDQINNPAELESLQVSPDRQSVVTRTRRKDSVKDLPDTDPEGS